MALSNAAKASIIFHLGWPSKTLDVDSTHYNRTVADRLNNLSEEAEDIVVDLITAIETARTKLEASQGRALVKRVGDIELNTEEAGSLKRELSRLVRELSAYLDIPSMKGTGNIPVVV